MKVGFLHMGPAASGVRRYGCLLAAELRRQGVDVIEAEAASAPTTLGPGGVRYLTDRLADAHVVHMQHRPGAWGGGVAGLTRIAAFLRVLRRPIVVTIHDLYGPPGQARAMAKRELAMVVRGSAAVLVCSESERSRLAGLRTRVLAQVIPHFVETRHVADRRVARQRLGLEGARVLTVLGFIHPRKGHGLLLDALELLPPDHVAVFAGGPPARGDDYANHLMRLAQQRGLGDRVRLTGFLPEAELNDYLAATDLAICPFERVSASGSLSTWIGARRPILATDLPLLDEYRALEPTAIRTFAPRTPEALAVAVAGLALDAAPQHRQALDRLAQRLSLTRVARSHRAVYEAVARP